MVNIIDFSLGINQLDEIFNNGYNIVYSTNVGLGSTQPQSITGLATYTGISTT